jgi:uncharacterized protein YodC (DUF2158 family)
MANEVDSSSFKDGDIVELRSGGPAMTVERAISASTVKCVWFDGSGSLKRDQFAASSLKAAARGAKAKAASWGLADGAPPIHWSAPDDRRW